MEAKLENAELKRVLKEIQEITEDVKGYVKKTNPDISGSEYTYPLAMGVIQSKVDLILKKVR